MRQELQRGPYPRALAGGRPRKRPARCSLPYPCPNRLLRALRDRCRGQAEAGQESGQRGRHLLHLHGCLASCLWLGRSNHLSCL